MPAHGCNRQFGGALRIRAFVQEQRRRPDRCQARSAVQPVRPCELPGCACSANRFLAHGFVSDTLVNGDARAWLAGVCRKPFRTSAERQQSGTWTCCQVREKPLPGRVSPATPAPTKFLAPVRFQRHLPGRVRSTPSLVAGSAPRVSEKCADAISEILFGDVPKPSAVSQSKIGSGRPMHALQSRALLS